MSESVGYIWVDKPCECLLYRACMEDCSHEAIGNGTMPHLVAMAEVETSPMANHVNGTMQDFYTDFFRKIVEKPCVMVPRDYVHRDAAVGKFREGSEEADIPLRDYVAVFEPEVEYIAGEK